MSEEKSFNRGLLWLSGALVVAFVVVTFMSWWNGQPRGKDAFLIPQGYQGEIVVNYNVDGAPKLEEKDGYFEHAIGSDGKLNTSTKNETSFPRGEDKFYYVDADGNKTELKRDQEIWDGFLKQKSGDPVVHGHFYVGTKEEYTKWSLELKELEKKEKDKIRVGL